MKRNRIGTLQCWLFGHKFVGWFYGNSMEDVLTKRATNYCSRCGISREQVNEESTSSKENTSPRGDSSK